MTAPETNIEKQKRRHRPSLIGIGLAAFAAVVIAVTVVMWPSDDVPDEPTTTTIDQ